MYNSNSYKHYFNTESDKAPQQKLFKIQNKTLELLRKNRLQKSKTSYFRIFLDGVKLRFLGTLDVKSLTLNTNLTLRCFFVKLNYH